VGRRIKQNMSIAASQGPSAKLVGLGLCLFLLQMKGCGGNEWFHTIASQNGVAEIGSPERPDSTHHGEFQDPAVLMHYCCVNKH